MPDLYDADGYESFLFPRAGAGRIPTDRTDRADRADRAERRYTVSEINKYIKSLFNGDLLLQDLHVTGEVSNYRPHYSGHMYFTLKDGECAIRCVMFKGAASRLRFSLENGQNIVARGNISVFERDGQYQLYCEEIHADGVGDLYTAFEQMKNKLAAEGLFDQSRKKPLPLLPGSVCVLTSPTGSVVRDIINVSVRRFPSAVIKIFPVQVQGPAAAPQIARAIGLVNSLGLADVVIVARGGGSLEDLWVFNEESVARAVAASGIPVVSAVGHETDYTICDFAADLRAPTPSAAAELVFPEAAALRGHVENYHKTLCYALRKKSDRARRRLERCAASRAFARPTLRVEYARMRLNGAEEKLTGAMRAKGEKNSARIAVLSARLNALSPLATLARGYSVATRVPEGGALKSAAETAPGRLIDVKLHRGALRCEVLETTADDGYNGIA